MLLLLLASLAGAASGGWGAWTWAALWAPAAGVLAAGLLPARMALVPLLFTWLGLLLLGPGPDPVAGATAVGALGAVGWAAGPRPASVTAVALALAAGGLLAGAATLWGAAVVPLEPGLTALWLDASPVGWVCESAGLDWMRHAAIYEAAGSGDLDPGLRSAREGLLGPALLLAVALVAGAGRRRLAGR